MGKPHQKGPRDWPQMRMGKKSLLVRKEDPANMIRIGEAERAMPELGLVVIKLSNNVVPYFTAGIYGGGTRRMAAVHEVFGKFNEDVFCTLLFDDPAAVDKVKKGDAFRADKFKCLDFERVKGASQVTEKMGLKKQPPRAGAPEIVRKRGSNYRTNAENERVNAYKLQKIKETRQDARHMKKEFLQKTIEKRGRTVNINRRVTFTD